MKNLLLAAHSAVCVIIIAMTATSCSSSKQEGKENSGTITSVSPGQCRIRATVIAVQDIQPNAYGVCAKVPCVASVRVDTVYGYGAGFSGVIAQGKTITLSFAFTLAPTTEELFPNLSERLPGLSVGDSFSGSITSVGAESTYTIYSYTKK
ncbi:MAG: hypothetical protein JNL32_01760 [Candidatus Kapabacteria bacterium]|nr:hypothetical protein [Candidatus Kapabacteria bacterium]